MRLSNSIVCLRKAQWNSVFLVVALLPVLSALNSCGRGGSSSTPVATPSISASCAASSVTLGGQVQCSATITNLSSTLVNWSVSGTGTGTINSNGLYTAPGTLPATNVVTITAAAQAQTSLTATATITINKATAINAVTCLDSTKTPSLTVSSGMLLGCTATDSGGIPIPVFWQVNMNTGGNAMVGQINAQGNYLAPLVPPAGGTVTITAISQAVSTQTKSVTVNVTFGNKVLHDSYAFSMSGRFTANTANNAFFSRVGSFISDGNGGVSGKEDVTPLPGTITSEPIQFNGTYSIGPDGRGTMQFCEPLNATTCTVPTSQFRVVVVSPQQVQIVDFQGSSAASGEIVSQPDNSVFKNGGLKGSYAFSFSGVSSAASEESVVGQFVADGSGNVSAGELDMNAGGALTKSVAITSGTYSISSDGRGTATLITSIPKTLKFAFYMVSASRAKFLETDLAAGSSILSGDSYKQQTINQWGFNSLNAVVVLQASGANAAGAFLGEVGAFKLDGAGNITAGTGLLDENNGGAISSTPPFPGTYAVDPPGTTGRGTIAIPNHSYVFYLISANNAVIQETTAAPSVVAHGLLTQPQGGSFTSASLSGSYALALAGQNAAMREEVVLGRLTADGLGTLTAGLLDINNFGAPLTTDQTNIGTYTPVDGSTGRTTILLNPTRNLVLYFVSPTQLYVLDTDTTGAATGSLYKQF